MSLEIPVVDLRAADVVDRLDRACREVGFLALVGHGLDDADGARVIDAARTVLSVGAGVVDRLLVDADPNFRGYERAEGRLAFEIGREQATAASSLCGPNRWPEVEGIDAARAVLETHFGACSSVAERITTQLVAAGHLPGLAGRDHRGGPAHLRVWRYPPGRIDLPAHADHGFLTLLVAPEPGLEVMGPDGRFHGAPRAGGSLVLVNVGRLLAHASAGRYRATVHRVRSDVGAERYSAPFFHAPRDDLQIAPPREGDRAPRTVGAYVEWGYSWQRRVNAGDSVADATDGLVEY